MTLLITGWVAIDEIETPFLKAEGLLGGSAPFPALAASLFTDVRLLAAIGDDFPPEERAKLDGRRIDLAGVTTVPGGKTSRWGGRYHYDMNTRDTLYTELGVNADFVPVLPPGWERSETAFLAAGIPARQRDVIRQLVAPRATMVDTIRFYIEGDRDELMQTLAAADFVCINDSEARMLAETPSVARAARTLLRQGAKAAVIKLGEYGAVYTGTGEYFAAPGYPIEEIVDPTGAGDAFAGGFMGYLDSVPEITPGQIRRAVIYGSAVASFTVEGVGVSRLLDLTRSEVELRYREFRALTHFDVGE